MIEFTEFTNIRHCASYMKLLISEGKDRSGLGYILNGFNRKRFTLGMLVAQDETGGIGYQNQLPWHEPNDLKVFRTLTTDKVVIMGRKTYESLPMFPKALPDRFNIIITSNPPKNNFDNVAFVKTKRQAIKLAKSKSLVAYVIGGASIYKMFMNDVDFLISTIVRGKYTTDTKMPPINNFIVEMVLTYSQSSIGIRHVLYKNAKSPFTFNPVKFDLEKLWPISKT